MIEHSLQKMLVIAAHPDDEVLGCGGTISRFANEGHDIYVAILGEGITSRHDNHEQSHQSLITTLQENCQQVAEMLGARDLFLFQLPDNRFDTIPLLDVVKIVEELIDQIHPQTIYTHHGGDLNIDHTVVHRAVITATRPMIGTPVREVYAFEVPSSTEWSFGQFRTEFRPNVFVDITDTLDLKLNSLSLYETEIKKFPHPRSKEGLKAIARRWGSTVGLEAAEAFELVRSIK